MKQKILLGVLSVVIFGVGFFAGMEYKAYQLRKALSDAFSGFTTETSEMKKEPETAMEQAKDEGLVTIDQKIGDEIELATINTKITKAEEKQIINVKYGSPKVAKENTKFVVVDLEITNTTKAKFSMYDSFMLVDDQGREFQTYSDSIGIDGYMNYRDLNPGVKEVGKYIYEIPSDANGYSIVMVKSGTKELYKVSLK